MPVKIVVASRNPVKIRAADQAFRRALGVNDVDVAGVAAESGVSDQPMSNEETVLGARNRSANARNSVPEADFWVGIEGGVENVNGRLQAIAWMSVLSAQGLSGEARTMSLPLPARIKALMDDGIELGEANDRVFDAKNSKQAGGAFGLLTNGQHTRESVYVAALEMALLPVIHPLYAE